MPAAQELRTFGKYHLIASLGQGGMAKVYLALIAGPSGFNKLLVVKIMRQDLLDGSEDSVRMFWDEARLAARLVHQNIVHTYEVGEHDGRYFLAMEYLDGQPLSAILNRARGEGEIPQEEYLRVIVEIAHGLDYAHHVQGFQGDALHVVHRDVSPQNVIVTYDGQVKLLDFGIAKTADTEHATQIGIVKGKLDYIAPEQLRGDVIDARADIFALGAMLWEVISGHRFAGGRKVSDVNKVQARIAGSERRLRSLRPDLPIELERIVERAIALDPADRFQDAASFAEALEHYLEWAGLRPGARSLASRLKPLFQAERAEIHKLIDEQVERIKSGVVASDEVSMEPPALDVRQGRGGFGLFVADAHIDSRSSIRSMASGTLARASNIAPAAGHRRSAALGAGLLMLVLAVVWFVWPAPTEAPEAARRAQLDSRVAAAAPASAPPSASDTQRPQSAPPQVSDGSSANPVRISVLVSPPEARISIDGVSVESPFQGMFRREAALHHIEVSADGYRPIKQFVAFDGDKQLDINLERTGFGKRTLGSFQRLIDRAEQTVEQNGEPKASAVPAPTPAPTTDLPAKAPENKRAREPVLDRPNPY